MGLMEEVKLGASALFAVVVVEEKEARTVVEVVVEATVLACGTDVLVVAPLGLVVEVLGATVTGVFFADVVVAPVRAMVEVVLGAEVGTDEGATVTAAGRPKEDVLVAAPDAQPAAARPRARTRPRNRGRKRQQRLPCFRNTICIPTSSEQITTQKGYHRITTPGLEGRSIRRDLVISVSTPVLDETGGMVRFTETDCVFHTRNRREESLATRLQNGDRDLDHVRVDSSGRPEAGERGRVHDRRHDSLRGREVPPDP